jgi:hypothetical protein
MTTPVLSRRRPRALCPSCGGLFSVRLDGALRIHRGQKQHYCPGSRRKAEVFAEFEPFAPDLEDRMLAALLAQPPTGDAA